jgi:para-nitrobenzyl esterase
MSTSDPRAVTCRISGGELVGAAVDGVARYLGVPYAAAPFGPRRFAAPEPVTPWHGTRDATDYGATAPQSPYPGALGTLLPTVTIPGEDILHVNLWAPLDRADGGWPVLVWFHGGSFMHGANALRLYDGTAFARRGLVVVSANYRLGAEGFSVLDGAPANLGLADQAAALGWVRDEIAAFGGNPDRVTAVGESAGGTTVAALMTSPRARRLLHRAVVQSGPLLAVPLDQAAEVTNRMAKHLNIATTRDAFTRVSPASLLATQDRVTGGRTLLSGGVGFAIAIDGVLVPQNPADGFHAGVADDVPLLTGTTTDEYRLWFVPDAPSTASTAWTC